MAGIAADAIHGNKSQNHRERVLAAFRTGEIRTLVATDIAARGIDVDGISHVVNFDLPNVPGNLCPSHRPHRAGRRRRHRDFARAGGEEMAFLRDIEKLIRIALPREDRRTPGHREAAPAASQHRGARSAPRVHGTRANDGAPGSKGPRRRAVPVVTMALRKPTATRPTGMSRRVHLHRRKAAARLKECKASPSCIAKAVRIPDPTAPNVHASRRSIWR